MKINIEKIIKKKKLMATIFVVCFVFIICSVFLHQVYTPLDKNTKEKIFVVEQGETLRQIAEELRMKRIIDSKWSFIFYVWLLRESNNLQAGNYSLASSMNIPKIANKIISGEVVRNWIKVTIPEGWTNKQIEERLTELNILDFENYKTYKISTESFPFLNDRPKGPSLEGYLFPDTYYFERDSTVEDVVKKILDNFGKKLDKELIREIERQEKTVYEIVTLASIIQNEANSVEEMAKIASVFHNRLAINMALQSDATINYITGEKDRRPLIKDTRVESPYNTYLHRGLPPGPISNPGIEAIKAVIYPAETDYLYFLHPLNSQAIFSKTLREHNRNKVKYF
jgi:UPF0755 protein